MIAILLVVLLVVLIARGGYGYSTGYMTYQHPLNIVLLVLLILVILALVGGPRWGLW